MIPIKSVILIDDDSDLGQLVKTNLSSRYDLKYFDEPLKALQFIRNHDVAAVILDYYLKNTNGLLVAWELIEAFPLIPILLISADESIKERIAELCFRHVRFLAKPFSSSELASNLVELQRIVNFEDIHPSSEL